MVTEKNNTQFINGDVTCLWAGLKNRDMGSGILELKKNYCNQWKGAVSLVLKFKSVINRQSTFNHRLTDPL